MISARITPFPSNNDIIEKRIFDKTRYSVITWTGGHKGKSYDGYQWNIFQACFDFRACASFRDLEEEEYEEAADLPKGWPVLVRVCRG